MSHGVLRTCFPHQIAVLQEQRVKVGLCQCVKSQYCLNVLRVSIVKVGEFMLFFYLKCLVMTANFQHFLSSHYWVFWSSVFSPQWFLRDFFQSSIMTWKKWQVMGSDSDLHICWINPLWFVPRWKRMGGKKCSSLGKPIRCRCGQRPKMIEKNYSSKWSHSA